MYCVTIVTTNNEKIIHKYQIKRTKMGALKIDCYLSETQMDDILKQVVNHIEKADSYSISDFDDTIHNVRVCVEFNFYLDKREIKSSAILDEDWDELLEDSAVFASRLRKILQDLSIEHDELLSQAQEIRNDRYNY